MKRLYFRALKKNQGYGGVEKKLTNHKPQTIKKSKNGKAEKR
jgi:hypothetical protein